MTVTHIGGLTIGETLPGPALAIATVAPGLEAQITALAEVVATPPALPSYLDLVEQAKAQIAMLEGIVAQLLASIAAGIQPPPAPEVNAKMALKLDELRAGLEIALSMLNLFGAAGVHAYAYAGTVGNFGTELGGALASGLPGGGAGDNANALVLVTTTPGTWSALSQVFKVTP